VHGPAMTGWILVALCVGTGAYCLLRMRSGSEQARRAAGGEAVMGFGMAVMAVPAAAAAPPAWGWAVYAAVFGSAALRALWLARTDPHHLHHLVGSAAMVYMAVTMAPAGAHSGHAMHTAGGVPLVTGALLAYFAVYVLRAGVRLMPAQTVAGASGSGGGGWGARPELALACRLSMGIGMLAMLVTL
jgi:hypothetical protein